AGTFGARIAALGTDAVVDLICFTPASAQQLVHALLSRENAPAPLRYNLGARPPYHCPHNRRRSSTAVRRLWNSQSRNRRVAAGQRSARRRAGGGSASRAHGGPRMESTESCLPFQSGSVHPHCTWRAAATPERRDGDRA